MKCFVCQKPAAFSFRWPWSTVLLAVCDAHKGDVTKKARAQACRVPELEPLTVPLVAPPALPGNGPGNKSTPSPHAPAQPPPLVDRVPGTVEVEASAAGHERGSVAGPAEDTRPGFKRPPPQLAHNNPPPPNPERVEAIVNGEHSPVAVVTIGKTPDGLGFTIRRLGQHDVAGSAAELVVTLAALGLVPTPAPSSSDEPPATVPPPRHAGASPGEFSHPGQVTPPNAASALAGAGSGVPAQARGARPPVNPPMGGMGVNPISRGPFRPQTPLGAVSTVSAVPGGQPPTPPPVAPQMAAPVAPEASAGGGSDPEGGSVVEGAAQPGG